MRIIKSYLIILFGCLIALFSCEKDDYYYTGKYISSSYDIKMPRLFTRNKEILDTQIINDYIERNDNLSFVIKNIDTIIDINGLIMFDFDDKDSVLCSIGSKSEYRIYHEVGDYIYLESKDTMFYVTERNPDNYIHKYMYVHSPIYEKSETFGSNGPEVTTFKPCYYLKAQESLIYLPKIGYNIKGEYLNYSQWNTNNEFNSNATIQMKETDTLLVQEIRITLNKQ